MLCVLLCSGGPGIYGGRDFHQLPARGRGLGTAAAHAQLQAEGVEAWYDAQVGAGQDWRIATAKALQASRIFVLLFSSSAAQSSDIAKELAAAVFEKKLIVPVRLEDIAPSGAFLYELASRNWINAYENTETRLAELAKGLAQMVRSGAVDESALPFDRSDDGRTPLSQKRLRKPILIAAAVTSVTRSSRDHYLVAMAVAALDGRKQPPLHLDTGAGG